jgi:AraC-like DNA-binding protein
MAAYGTLLLEGGYCEAGESGRWHVQPGMLIVHAAGESHTDWFGDRPTQLIDFSIPGEIPAGVYRPRDVDPLIGSLRHEFPHSIENLEPVQGEADWPDMLAADIRIDAGLSLGDWAERHGVRRETVSRGFVRAYGVSPAAYRLGVRVKAVLGALREYGGSLADLAAEHGFSDQSHMNRAIRAATGRTPTQIRNVKSVQDRDATAL